MISSTDIIVMVAFVIFFYSGWHKGFLRTLLGPICLVLGGVLGLWYYQKTTNILMSLGISIALPFMLNFIFSLLIKAGNKSENPGPSAGRLIGGLLSLAWSGGLLMLVIVALALLPFNMPVLANVQKDIKNSITYDLLRGALKDPIDAGQKQIENVTDLFASEQKLELIRSKDEYSKIMSNSKIKDILEDEETNTQIKQKNFPQLMINPKIQSIIQDSDLVKQLFELNKEILKQGLGGGQLPETAQAPDGGPKIESRPHVIELPKTHKEIE